MSDDNPYSPPQLIAERATPTSVRTIVLPPAIVLMTASILWGAWVLVARIRQFPEIMDEFHYGSPGYAIGFSVGTFITVAWCAGIVWGCSHMLRLKSLRLAKLAAWMALMPMCGPFWLLGIPIGIWALLALSRPQVLAAFRP